ncbi:hypothetical protein [Methanoregula sp.]|uniref:hypothetical protein n=1 Tax=Methanoregula sp. TaxID=2052170 RepID=UPI003568B6D6
MSGTPAEKSPLARLVLFMVCLSIAGSLVAGVHWFAIDLPAQQARALHPPGNGNTELFAACNICMQNCEFDSDRYGCEMTCKLLACGSPDP